MTSINDDCDVFSESVTDSMLDGLVSDYDHVAVVFHKELPGWAWPRAIRRGD